VAGPTTQQLSDRLEKHEIALRAVEGTTRTLDARVDHVREDIKRIDESLTRAAEVLSRTAALEAKYTALEKTVDELKKSLEERDRKQWLLWPLSRPCLPSWEMSSLRSSENNGMGGISQFLSGG